MISRQRVFCYDGPYFKNSVITTDMKVILLQDVAKIGRKSEIVQVPDGYALNQLIPKRMAEPATTANLKRIERQHAEQAASHEAGAARFETAAKALRDTVLSIATEINEQGHAFKAVHASDVVTAARAADIDIDTGMIEMDTHIKTEGEHEIELIGKGKKVKFTIKVTKK